MTAMIVTAMLGQLKAGPTDAFTLNRRSIRAEFDFSFSVGKLDKSHLIQNRLWTESRFAKREIPHMKIAGHWDSDGRAEHTICGPADASGRIGPLEGKPGNVVEGEPAMEVLTDGEVSAFHKILEGDRSIEVIPSGGSLVSYGPFHWFLEDFPFMLQRIFPKNLDHTVKSATINGHKCEYETYYLGDPQSFYELTVCYDPDVNFLPRYIRALTFNATGPLPNQADVAEFFLVDAQRCKSGGFIPITWNVAKYDIDAFTRRYPSYKTLDPIMPHQDNVTVYNFVGSNLRDKTSKSKLTEISENSLLGSKGGTVNLKDNPKSLSLDQIRARLGSKLTHPVNRVLPTLDYDEKTKTFSNPMWVRSKLFFACVLFGAILFGIFRLHRQRLAHHLPPALMLLGLALTCTGCSSRNPPVSKLSASFKENNFVYSNNRPALNLNLKLKNEGTAALKILNIDGGCSCRKVDHANIPATVSSGGEAVFKVELQNKGGFENQVFQFHIQLSDEKITVAAPLFALPDHYVSPSTLTFNLVEHGTNAPLEFIHREVFDEQKIPAECSVNTSPALKASKLNSVLGKVTRGERLAFRDTTYSLLVIDPSYGNHKESLRLQQGANNTAFEVPVLWTRSEFLESIPKRVLLKEDPMRIFLRCPDDKVEFTHILSHPSGVRAFVASPREIMAHLTSDAPDVIEDYIVVATNSPGGDRLKIPVIRYAAHDLKAGGP